MQSPEFSLYLQGRFWPGEEVEGIISVVPWKFIVYLLWIFHSVFPTQSSVLVKQHEYPFTRPKKAPLDKRVACYLLHSRAFSETEEKKQMALCPLHRGGNYRPCEHLFFQDCKFNDETKWSGAENTKFGAWGLRFRCCGAWGDLERKVFLLWAKLEGNGILFLWDLGRPQFYQPHCAPYSPQGLQITRINGGHSLVKNMAAIQFTADGCDVFYYPTGRHSAGAAEKGSSLASFVECCSSSLLKPCTGSQLFPASFCSTERQMGFSQSNIFSIFLRKLRHEDMGDSLGVM